MLTGSPPADPPLADVGLEVRIWDAVLDHIDLLLFASERLRQRDEEPLMQVLLASTVASVAAWDFETADMLVSEEGRTILNPCERLRGFAHERNWTADTPNDWRLGTTSRSGIAHPALAALENPPTELHRRLWSAQLSVLFPWIEERRQETVAENLAEIRRQMQSFGDDKRDPFELELGDLFRLFDQSTGSRRFRKFFKNFRDVRNKLAHGGHISYSSVLKLMASQLS